MGVTDVTAMVGLCLALASLSWQVMNYRLSGWRIQVHLCAAMIDANWVHTAKSGGWKSLPKAAGDNWVDAIGVTISNSGRSPVTITDVRLVLMYEGGGEGWNRPDRIPVRHAQTETRFRLDAGCEAKLFFSDMIFYLIRDRRSRFKVAAKVTVAGGPVISSPPEDNISVDTLAVDSPLAPTVKLDPLQKAWRRCWHTLMQSDETKLPDMKWWNPLAVRIERGGQRELGPYLDEAIADPTGRQYVAEILRHRFPDAWSDNPIR